MPQPRKFVPVGVLVIGYFKLISSILLVAFGIGIFWQIGTDPAIQTAHIVAALKLDPDNHLIHTVMETLSGVSEKQLILVSAGTFVYAILYAIEGIGLVLHKRWGEYVTIFITGSLIPFEFYEVVRHLTPLRSLILTLNVAIVAYLVVQLRRSHRIEAGLAVTPPETPAEKHG